MSAYVHPLERLGTGLIARTLRIVLMVPTLAVAMPTQDVIIEAERLMSAYNYSDAYRLLNANISIFAGEPEFDQLLARCALETEHPADALLALERVVESAPNKPELHLDMARAYFDLQQWQAAKFEIESILLTISSTPQRKTAYDYLQKIEDKLRKSRIQSRSYVEVGNGADDNANVAPSIDKFLNFSLSDSSRQRASSNQFARFNGMLLVDTSTKSNLSANLYAAQNWYPSVSFADNTMFGLGTTFSTQHNASRNQFTLQTYRTNLVDKLNNWGESITYMYKRDLSDTANVDINFRVGQAHFIGGYAIKDNHQYNMTLHGQLSLPVAAPVALDASINGGREIPVFADSPYARNYVGTSLMLTARKGKSDIFMQSSYTYIDYPKRFFGLTRTDNTADLSFGMNLNLHGAWQLRPLISTQHNWSSVELYEYRRTVAGLAIRRDFL